VRDGKLDLTKFMGGSNVGYQGPWGVYYPRNLTNDMETGIGAMTDEEVIELIKNEGNKSPLLNNFYINMTGDDLKSIVVYLRSLPPITNTVHEDLRPGESVKTAVINLTPVVPKVAAPVKKSAPAKAVAPVKKSAPAAQIKKKAPAASTKKTTTKSTKK
jgi:hypothetical protein